MFCIHCQTDSGLAPSFRSRVLKAWPNGSDWGWIRRSCTTLLVVKSPSVLVEVWVDQFLLRYCRMCWLPLAASSKCQPWEPVVQLQLQIFVQIKNMGKKSIFLFLRWQYNGKIFDDVRCLTFSRPRRNAWKPRGERLLVILWQFPTGNRHQHGQNFGRSTWPGQQQIQGTCLLHLTR